MDFISLIAVHILFVREHNHIAKILAHTIVKLPKCSIFIYNDYILFITFGYCFHRNETCFLCVNPAFTIDAFRMRHAGVYGKFHISELISIPYVIFSPDQMRKTSLYDYIVISQPMVKLDTSIIIGLAVVNIQRGRDQCLRPKKKIICRLWINVSF